VNYDNFINKDFRSRPQPKRHPHLRWTLFAAGCAVLGVVLASTNSTSEQDSVLPEIDDAVQATLEQDTETSSFKLNLPETKLQSAALKKDQINAFTEERNWTELKVKSGDSLSTLFDKAKIKPNQLIALMKLGSETRALTRIHPGDVIKVITNDEGQLQALHYAINSLSYLRVIRQQDDLSAKTLKHDIEKRAAYASAEIESSLFLASQKAGLSQNITMELANVFGWDIDFALDIRAGDKFTVIYEEIFKNGEKLKDGNILAAEFINQGKSFRALRYANPVTNTTGYYSPDGHSLRKAFLRSPVKFSRISSRFTTRRYHPLLHKFRSHKGVDYAASRGTPIRASGDGKVIFKGRKGGYGNTVVIKHGSRYSTLYAHLSKFNRKARSGSRVKQGQIIGYVGSTGLASGPHLHYEFRVNGSHRNPLTVKFPSTKPIPKRYRDNFELTTQTYVTQLDVLSRSTLAFNEN
jgi:murein DD-endopeptidase MepM/ murein hydrolase activator NlpD